MILLIDNYDSFAYNLYQMVGALEPDIKVIRNDEMTPEEITPLHPDAIILSPGPGRPEDAGYCIDVVRTFEGRMPIMGVCLGEQVICTAYGGTVSYASRLMHGKQSIAEIDTESPIFAGLPEQILVARYHSLALKEETLPEELKIIARADDGEVMAVQHKTYPVFGLQFHPESIMTKTGPQILKNFTALMRGYSA